MVKMKFELRAWLVAAAVALNAAAATAEPSVVIPNVRPPVEILEEGTESRLSPKQMEEILPWAVTSKSTLENVLEMSKVDSTSEAIRILERGIENVVSSSGGKRTELLMRYVLTRALKVAKIHDEYTKSSQPGAQLQKLRVLKLSAELALKYYKSDLDYLNGNAKPTESLATLPFANFGMDYAQFLMTINESQMNAKAQVAVAQLALGLLQWDLYRDVNQKAYGTAIHRIHTFLELTPEAPDSNDVENVERLRRIRKVRNQALSDFGFVLKSRDQSADSRSSSQAKPSSTSEIREGRVSIGQDVYYNGYAAKIIGVSTDGLVAIQYRDYTNVISGLKPSQLAFAQSGLCAELGYCVGTKVVFGVFFAKIVAINPDGKITIQYQDHTNYNQSADRLALREGASRLDSRFYVGRKVIFGGYRSTIVGIFKSGDVVVKYDEESNIVGPISVQKLFLVD